MRVTMCRNTCIFLQASAFVPVADRPPKISMISDDWLVLRERIELSTSPLPMECSTTELPQRAPAIAASKQRVASKARSCAIGRGARQATPPRNPGRRACERSPESLQADPSAVAHWPLRHRSADRIRRSLADASRVRNKVAAMGEDAKAGQRRRLAEALRANLRRRKAAGAAQPQNASEPPAPAGARGGSGPQSTTDGE